MTKPKRCKVCRDDFTPARPMQAVCGPLCGLKLARDKREKAERRDLAVARAAVKTRRQWLAECQAVVNRYCRLRDLSRGLGCISCGAMPAQKVGGTMDCGHYRSVGSAPHLRFFTPQLAAQCVVCNRHKGGNALLFRRGLIERLGAARVEEIEGMQGTAKFDIPYLKRLKAVFSKKARRQEKRNAMRC